MRLLLLLLLLLPGSLAAQGLPLIERLEERAEASAAAGKFADAEALYIDAALIAETHHQPRHQVSCLMAIAALHQNWDAWDAAQPDKSGPILEAALKLAIEFGDAELERQVLASRYFIDPFEFDRDRFDACLAQGMTSELEMFCQDAMFDADEDTIRLIEQGFTLVDTRVKAAWAKDPASLLEKAAGDAAKLKLPRMQIALLRDAGAHKGGLEPAIRRLLEARGAKVELARMDVAEAPARAEGATLDDWKLRLQAALNLGVNAGDYGLQESAARALGTLTGDSRWGVVADNAKRRARAELLMEGERARRKPETLTPELREKLLAQAGDGDFDKLIKTLGIAPPAPLTPEQKKKYTDALDKALATEGGKRFFAVVLADIAARPEGAGPLLKLVKADQSWFLDHLQGLPGPEHVPLLIELLDHKLNDIRTMAAAELFRLNPDGLQDRAAKFVKEERNAVSRAWILGWLARHGDANALNELEGIKPEARDAHIEASAVLMSLGYASAYRSMAEHVTDPAHSWRVGSAINRLPTSMGATLIYPFERSETLRMRMFAKRGTPNRLSLLTKTPDAAVALFGLPMNEEEARTCGTGELLRMEQIRGFGDEHIPLVDWMADRAGMGGAGIDSNLGGEGPFSELVRAERETSGRRNEGLVRTLVLVDKDEVGRARCRITAVAGNADIIDGRLVVPFRWTYDLNWEASGILGALYEQVIGAISLAGLFQKAELAIPGYEAIAGEVGVTLDGKPALRFPLPKKLGEGLADDEPLDRETILAGTVTVTFNFIDNPGAINFPVTALELPKADKPDLVAKEFIIDPPMPEYGRPTRMTLIVRNEGCSVKTDVLATASFYAKNPQGPEGWRKIYAEVFAARGWQPGEIRTFESRPLLVDGYFMNTYSYTYDPVKGDTMLKGGVDSFNQIEEGDEANNTREVQLPLELPEDLAKPLASDEALKALEQPFADLLAAQTMDELQAAYGRAANIIIPMEQQLPEIRIIGRHLMARYDMKKASIRAKEALEKLKRWQAEGNLSRERVIMIRDTLQECQQDLLDSGVPTTTEALEKARNATLLANNAAGALDDLAKLQEISGLDAEGPAAGNTLKALDGAMLVATECSRMIEEGKADAGNLLDASSNFAESLGLNIPGLSNLHRELLKAEVEYATKGFEKSADTLDIIAEMIEKGDSEERSKRLNESVGEVDRHLSAGPFNENSLKDIAKGWVKDLPVVGKIADVLFSWK
jgi:hypothetical protein